VKGGVKDLIDDPWEFGAWLDGTPDAENRGLRHMLLFLIFPDFYERIATARHKNTIAATFAHLAQESVSRDGDPPAMSLDKTLFSIRKALDFRFASNHYRARLRLLLRKMLRGETLDVLSGQREHAHLGLG